MTIKETMFKDFEEMYCYIFDDVPRPFEENYECSPEEVCYGEIDDVCF